MNLEIVFNGRDLFFFKFSIGFFTFLFYENNETNLLEVFEAEKIKINFVLAYEIHSVIGPVLFLQWGPVGFHTPPRQIFCRQITNLSVFVSNFIYLFVLVEHKKRRIRYCGVMESSAITFIHEILSRKQIFFKIIIR